MNLRSSRWKQVASCQLMAFHTDLMTLRKKVLTTPCSVLSDGSLHFPPAKLHKLLREDVDADVIKVEYIDFVKEEITKDKADRIWNVDYF